MNTQKRTNDADFYFRLPAELKGSMVDAAGGRGLSASEWLRRAITAAVKKEARRCSGV